MISLKSTLIIAVTTLSALVTLPMLSAAGVQGHERISISADSGGTLTLEAAFIGSIKIKTHDDDVVTFGRVFESGDLNQSEEYIDCKYETINGNVTISIKLKEAYKDLYYDLKICYALILPKKYNVIAKTSGSSVDAEGIYGQVKANTSGGSIRFRNINGQVEVRTGGGGVVLRDVKSNVDVRTSGGGITMDYVNGNVFAQSSGGNITLGTVTGRFSGKTSGGSIIAELVNQIEHPLELHASGGHILLTVPGDFKADFEVRASRGRLNLNLPIKGEVKNNSIEGKLNGGGPKVTLLSLGGNIKLAKR